MNAMMEVARQESEIAKMSWEEKVARGLVRRFSQQNGATVSELVAKDDKRLGRSGELHDLRAACWDMLRRETDLSYPDIGRMFSGRDHKTIMAGVKKHREKEMGK